MGMATLPSCGMLDVKQGSYIVKMDSKNSGHHGLLTCKSKPLCLLKLIGMNVELSTGQTGKRSGLAQELDQNVRAPEKHSNKKRI